MAAGIKPTTNPDDNVVARLPSQCVPAPFREQLFVTALSPTKFARERSS